MTLFFKKFDFTVTTKSFGIPTAVFEGLLGSRETICCIAIPRENWTSVKIFGQQFNHQWTTKYGPGK
jgi:hypothetical protein